ncbi:MAG: exodeoxyribonuclease VII small subunit [Alphaproteobacteria bacterium]|nr:exodeoxyribonuclease VII small subunit [Alphaproteobacteria bacterium]
MAEEQIAQAIEKMSYEEALTALEEIVRQMEAGKVKLDEAIDFYERGMLLRRHCEKKLSDARSRIDQITTSLNAQAVGFTPVVMENNDV